MRNLVLPIGCILLSVSAFFAAITVAQSPDQSEGQRASSSERTSSSRSSDRDEVKQSGSSATGQKKAAEQNKANQNKADQNQPAESKSGRIGQDKPAQAKAGAGKAGISKVLPGITPEREAAVMTFVKRHHPELTELLIHLKENAPKEYDRAVRELLRTSERLAQIQERDSLTYELELQSWKARSRAQLLAARLQMGESSELREQLRAALNEEYDLRLQLLERDREKAADRLKNLGEQIDRISQRRAEEIDRQLKQLTSAARGGEAKAKGKAKAKAKEDFPPNKKTESSTN
jgi:hypothetical protein